MDTSGTSTTIETPLAILHKTAGATMASWFGCDLPDRWLDPQTEENFARNSVALMDKNYRSYLSFSGPDRVRYLNAILTNNIKDLRIGQGNVSLLLNPQGRILAEVETYAAPDRLFCVSHRLIRERLVEWLDKYIIMDDVTLADESQRFGTLALEGPQASPIVRDGTAIDLQGLAEFERRETALASIPCWLTKRSHGAISGCEFLVERPQLAELWRVLLDTVKQRGGGPMGYAALSARRLAQGIPWFSYDFGEKQIPHEAGLQDSHISYTKGCYTGQEIVERVRSRGQVNRQRAEFLFDNANVPPSGEPLTVDGQEEGFVTRAALSAASPHAIGMGYLRREHAALGTRLQWSGGSATVCNLPEVLRS